MSTLSLNSSTVAFDDLGANSNPSRTPINWKRTVASIPCENASTDKYNVDAQGSKTIIDGTRSLSIDGTTAFSLTLSTLDPAKYLLTNTGGTAPAFRTARSVPVAAVVLTLTVGANQTLTVAAGSGTPFSAVVVGDEVLIPGVSTGDPTSPFNTLNLGYWTVLTKTSTVLVLTRLSGEIFEGYGEVVTPVANTDFQVFSAVGVQVGDTVDLTAGFASTSLRAYEVTAVTASRIEILSTTPLGNETGVSPTASGLIVYTAAKRYLCVYSDQECIVRLNGDTGSFNRTTPWIAANRDFMGTFEITGPVWKLVLVNRSNVPANVVVLSVE